jgi:hypothetical protein
VVGVVDGLGHGPSAREASDRAVQTLHENAASEPDRIVIACHEALRGTRGAVMTVARIEDPDVFVAAVGNVSAHLYGRGRARRVGGTSFVLGSPGAIRKQTVEALPIDDRGVLILFSDGLTTRTDLEEDLDLLREHPVVIAQRLVERFGRDNDDAIALVVR